MAQGGALGPHQQSASLLPTPLTLDAKAARYKGKLGASPLPIMPSVGFEPTTSSVATMRSIQAELRRRDTS